MPIIASELVVFGSEAMDDTATGGGRRGAAALTTGAQNNVWPDVTADDALNGRTKVRKLYPSVVDDAAALLQSATLMLNDKASDPLVSVCLVAYGDDATQRAAFDTAGAPYVSGLESVHGTVGPVYWASENVVGVDGGDATLTVTGWYSPGEVLSVEVRAGGASATQATIGTYSGAPFNEFRFVGQRGTFSLHSVVSLLSGTLTIDPPIPGAGTGQSVLIRKPILAGGRAYGCLAVSGTLTAADDTLTLSEWTVPLVPVGTAYPSVDLGLSSALRAAAGGLAPAIAMGDMATLFHEAATTPGARANSDVINVGRTNLSQMALVDNNGAEIGRVLAGGPAGPASFTVDLAAGTLTCVDVSGWAQPVYVRHRISERVAIATVEGPAIGLGAGISRDYPSGAMLTTELPLGDLQPTIGTRLFQQAWTRVWADTVIGAAAGTMYLGDIGLQADGAENDRYACVFSSATQFTLHSERWGVVGTGNIGTDYVPLNPSTGQPLLTLYAAGWVAGSIALGNVFRFNVRGAYGRAWGVQCIRPGATVGNASVPLLFRGSVDA